MYLVEIINGSSIEYINIVSTDINAPRIKGKIKQGINVINSFSFTVLSNNPCFFDVLKLRKTLIKVTNTQNNKIEFYGRILKESRVMESSGLFYKNYVCEDAISFLNDSYQVYEELHNITVKDYLIKLITKHNSQVESYKRIKLGEIDVIDSNNSLYRYTSYSKTYENIKNDLLDKLGGELRLRYEEDGLYLDYLNEIGKVSNTEIKVGYNLKQLEGELDPSEFYTRIIPLGAKLEINEETTEKRLTIASLNNGEIFLDYKEGIEEFGINVGYLFFDDVTEVRNLLSKANAYIASLKLNISNKITALDLSLINLDIEGFEVGNYYRLYNDKVDVDYETRIIEKTIDIASPHLSELSFGDRKATLTERQVKALKLENNYVKLKQNVDKIQNNINTVNNNITNTIDRIETIEGDLSGYITVDTYNTLINNINTRFNKIEDRLTKLEGGANE